MKVLKYVLAFIITIALLYIARNNAMGRSELVTHSENGYTLELNTVPKTPEKSKTTVELTVLNLNDSLVGPVIRTSKFGQDATTPLYKYNYLKMTLKDSANSVYAAEISSGAKGGRIYYYFELRDNIGSRGALLTDKEGRPFLMKFIGEVPQYVLILHIFLIFASVFFISAGFIEAIKLVRGATDPTPMMRNFLWATILIFLGGYPAGFAMNWYAFGAVWEGVPFGTDATDNKTQLVFVYMLFMLLAGLRSMTGKCGRDLFGPKALGLLGIVAFLVQLGVNLVPHSIQFGPTETKVFCYSFIGILFLFYLVCILRPRPD